MTFHKTPPHVSTTPQEPKHPWGHTELIQTTAPSAAQMPPSIIYSRSLWDLLLTATPEMYGKHRGALDPWLLLGSSFSEAVHPDGSVKISDTSCTAPSVRKQLTGKSQRDPKGEEGS